MVGRCKWSGIKALIAKEAGKAVFRNADAINNPVKTTQSINRYTGNTITLNYIDDVHYVAVDDVTGKVIQVSDKNITNWKADDLFK